MRFAAVAEGFLQRRGLADWPRPASSSPCAKWEQCRIRTGSRDSSHLALVPRFVAAPPFAGGNRQSLSHLGPKIQGESKRFVRVGGTAAVVTMRQEKLRWPPPGLRLQTGGTDDPRRPVLMRLGAVSPGAELDPSGVVVFLVLFFVRGYMSNGPGCHLFLDFSWFLSPSRARACSQQHLQHAYPSLMARTPLPCHS